MKRLAAVPAPAPPAKATTSGAPDPDRLLTVVELAMFLAVSRAEIERLVRVGLPSLDLSVPRRLGARRKRALRFDRAAVLAWLRARPRP
jgi:predicted DNA-binding transcriptional regulator AlpA